MARADKWMEPYANPIDPLRGSPIYGDAGSLVMGGASLLGGMMGSDAASSAADAQIAAANQANNTTLSMFNKTQENLSPYMTAGSGALAKLSSLLGIGPVPGSSPATPAFTPLSYDQWVAQQGGGSGNMLRNLGMWQQLHGAFTGNMDPTIGGNFVGNAGQADTSQQAYQQYLASHPATAATAGKAGTPTADYGSLLKPFDAATFNQFLDPSYQWQLNQGNMALQNSQAAKDGILSGAALKDLIGYNQGMASTNYQNAFSNYNTWQNNVYNRLSNLASLGENAASNNGNNATNFANTLSGNTIGAGNAAAAGTIGSANAITGGVNNALGYYQLNRMINQPSSSSNFNANTYLDSAM